MVYFYKLEPNFMVFIQKSMKAENYTDFFSFKLATCQLAC